MTFSRISINLAIMTGVPCVTGYCILVAIVAAPPAE
jgi:hypothetical protein